MDNTVIISYNGEDVAVSAEVAAFLETDERRNLAERRRDRRHLSDMEFTEDTVELFAVVKPVGFEDAFLRSVDESRLRVAIMTLTETQRRRLTAYYYEGLTYREIAAREDVVFTKIANSVSAAIESLKKYFS
ncbi:MAG: hypothetical protein LBN02_04485 [Oscillospiraceae bacterium]|jgi:RNA polymerase sigma-70 factor (ECF subfamily)|nr:hypothetical protein [Oscillospiraceae bacterium]